MEIPPQPERRFVRAGLPWAIAVVGALIYMATLSRWLTLNSLPLVAEVSRWQWQPLLSKPVLFLLTFPVKWLPAPWTPLALNLFAAVCGSLTLALLARSVALLPQDRLQQQRLLLQDEHGLLTLRNAWVAPALAAVALGLQLSFWENATAASGEMLDLLLFATVIWCLLEHRCDPRPRWLDRAALVCGLALANSWAMAVFVPLVAVALIWSRRLKFFNVRFLQRIESSAWKKTIPALSSDGRFFLRMMLFGLAGLSLLLLLPLLQAFSPDSALSFWQALRGVLGAYKSTIMLLAGRCFLANRDVSLLMIAVSLAPVLFLSIRWRAAGGLESSRQLDPMSIVFYVAHAFLLLVCLSIPFDPPFSPRQLGRRLGLGLPFLPLYYLSALSIGYYSGFFLLIFTGYPGRRKAVLRALRWTAPKLVYALLGITLAGLLWKNLPTIRVKNGRQLEHYAGFVTHSLPPGGAVICSYDASGLALVRAALEREGKAGRYVPVDANALPYGSYRAWLRRNYPKQWTEPAVEATPENQALDAGGFLRLMSWLAQSNRVCYLQPSYDYLAEQFHLQPRGLVYELKPYPTNSFSGSPLTKVELAESEMFCKRVIETEAGPLARLITEAEQGTPGFAGRLMKKAHITPVLPDSVRVLANWYSTALNGWGATLQRHGRWQAATPCFATAIELNPDNLSAVVNLQCNSNRLAGREMTLGPARSQEDLLGKYRNWNQVLTINGPLDEPNFCYHLGLAYAQGKLLRQAAQHLDRVRVLAPRDINARLLLGEFWYQCRMPDRALQIATDIKTDPALQPIGPKEQAGVAFLEAKVWLAKTNQAKAAAILQSVAPKAINGWLLLGQLWIRCQQPDRALQVVTRIQADPSLQPLGSKEKIEIGFMEAEAWLAKTNQAKAAAILQGLLNSNPGDPVLLDRAKVAFAQLRSYTNAIHATDQQLQLAPDNMEVLLQKGLLCLQAGEFSNAIPALTRLLSLTNIYTGRMYRAQAYAQSGQWDAAAADCQEALRAFPASFEPYQGLAEAALHRGDTNAANQYHKQYLSNALHVTEQQLRLAPDNPDGLLQKGLLCVQAGDFSNAIPTLTRLLSLTNTYAGRMSRAQAYAQSGQWDAATADYQTTLRLVPAAYQPFYGLAEVARSKGDTNAAIGYYQQYLSRAPTNQFEFRAVMARLQSLQPRAP